MALANADRLTTFPGMSPPYVFRARLLAGTQNVKRYLRCPAALCVWRPLGVIGAAGLYRRLPRWPHWGHGALSRRFGLPGMRALLHRFFGAREVERAVYQRDVGKRLWEISEQA